MMNTTTPIVHIKKTLPVFKFDTPKPIQIGLTPTEATKSIALINDNISQFDLSCEPAIAAATKTEPGTTTSTIDELITKCIESCKRDIIFSAMSKDFELKYRRDMNSYIDSTELLKFIKETFGELNERQSANAAHRELNNMSRRSSDNEPFTMFLNRLERTAKGVSNEALINKYQVQLCFRANLTPSLKSFLLDNDKLEEDCTTIAQYLDHRMKHKKSIDVNSVERMAKIDQLEQLLINQSAQMAQLTQLVQSSLQTKPMEQLAINAIGKTSRSNGTTKNWNGARKERCAKCGMFNHTTSQCSGRCNMTCRRCHRIGHLEAVCKLAAKNL